MTTHHDHRNTEVELVFLPGQLAIKPQPTGSSDHSRGNRSVNDTSNMRSSIFKKVLKTPMKMAKRTISDALSASGHGLRKSQSTPEALCDLSQLDITDATCSLSQSSIQDEEEIEEELLVGFPSRNLIPQDPPSPSGQPRIQRQKQSIPPRSFSSDGPSNNGSCSSIRRSKTSGNPSHRRRRREESETQPPRRTRSNRPDGALRGSRGRSQKAPSPRSSSSVRRSTSVSRPPQQSRCRTRSRSTSRLTPSGRNNNSTTPPPRLFWECTDCDCQENEERFNFCVGCGKRREEQSKAAMAA